MSNLLFHIHWGTGGNGGLYIDEIYEALKSEGFNQEVFVNYYFPFKYGHKLFFKYSSVGHCSFDGIIRSAIMFIEAVCAFIYILLRSIKQKPCLVNYSLVSGCFSFVILFLKVLKKKTKSRLIITCHDVMPLKESIERNKKELSNRRKLFGYADYLLVHNNSSKLELIKHFGVDSSKIIYHRFPIQDLLKLHEIRHVNKEFDFLFIGHLRSGKGIELLLDGWKKFHQIIPEARLCVAGRNVVNIDTKAYEKMGIVFYLHYISDNEFCDLVCRSRYVILPYLEGSNSGIVSDVMSLGASVITSDLPMFRNNDLIDKSCLFKSGNIDSLIQILKDKYLKEIDLFVRERVDRYKIEFKNEVVDLYNGLISDNEK